MTTSTSLPNRRTAHLLATVSLLALSASLARTAQAGTPTSLTVTNGTWSDGTQWNNGAPNIGNDATVNNGGTVSTDGSNAAGTLQIGPKAGSTVNVLTGNNLQIGATITNNGTLNLGGYLQLVGDVTLSGSAPITITGTPTGVGGQIGTNGNSYTLTNQTTIQGSGLIGSNVGPLFNVLNLNNAGVINANSTANALQISGSGGSVANSGTMEATGGGALILSTVAPIQNGAGLIRADGTGSTVTVASRIQGGTLTTTNGGIIQTSNGGATLDAASSQGAITLTNGSIYTANTSTTSISGTLNLGTTSSANLALGSALQLFGDTTLNGPGAVTITGNATSSTGGQIGTNSNSYTLTNNVSIQGSGTIGSNNTTFNTLNLTNNKDINANTSGQTLAITGSGGAIVNAGTLEATGGGLMTLSTVAPIQNGAGLIRADGTGSTVTVASRIQGGTLTTTNGGVIQTSGGGATLDAVSQGAITLTNGSTYTANASTTSISGTLNLGTTSSANLALGSALQLFGDTTLNGPGAVTITGNATSSTGGQIGTNSNSYTLTNNVSIQGSGTIGSNNTTFNNLNLTNIKDINANTSGQTLAITGSGGAIVNAGTLEATGGGLMTLSTVAPIQNRTGLIRADGTGSTVTVASRIQGGTLTTTNGGVIQTSGGGATLDAVSQGAITLTNGSTYTANASTTSISGTLNLGTTSSANLALGSALQLFGDTTLAGPGVTTLSGNGQIGTNSNSYTLTNQSTIQGAGVIGSNAGALYQNLSLTNAGLINANVTGQTLSIQGTGGSIVNTTLLQATNGGTLNLATSAAVQNSGATISAIGAGSSVTVSNTTIRGGTLVTSGGGTMRTVGASFLDAATGGAITLADGSTYTSDASAFTSVQGTFNLGTSTGATLALGGQMQLVNDTKFNGPGAVTLSGNAQLGTNSNNYTLTNQSTIQGAGVIGSNVGALYQNLSLTNAGLINANVTGQTLSIQGSGGSIVNTTVLEATNGGTLNLATTQPVQNSGATIAAIGVGSSVTISNTTIRGGTLVTSGGGTMRTVGSSALDGLTAGAITLADGSTLQSGPSAFTTVQGKINLGTSAGSTLALSGSMQMVNDTTLSGAGTLLLSGSAQIGTNSNAYTLTNQATIQGSGLIGSNVGSLYNNGSVNNQGRIIADGGTLTVANTGGLTNSGTLLANAGATLAVTAPLTNFKGQTLTGGTYIARANGTVSFTGADVAANAAAIVLDGAGSALKDQNGQDALRNLATNSGSLTIQNGRNFTTSGALANSGTVAVGAAAGPGSTFTAISGITGPTGTLQINQTGTAMLNANSTVGTLANNGKLALGTNDIIVGTDYTNANFGTGNSFDKHAGVTGSGKILAAGDASLAVSGSGVTQTGSQAYTVGLGNFHTTGTGGASFTIGNAGTTGPVLRGAVQTTGGGIGLTASDFGPLAAGASTTETLTFTPSAAGAVNQTVTVVSNFDNVAPVTVGVTGAAYNLARAATISPVNFGNVHVGDSVSQALTIQNTAATGAFTEKLDARFGTASDARITNNGGSVGLLAAGSSDSSSLRVGLNTAAAGTVNGTQQVLFASNGQGTSGLGITSLPTQNVGVTGTISTVANVYGYAIASAASPNPVILAARVGGVATQALSISNTAPNTAFYEKLDGSITSNSSGITASGAFSLLAGGSSSSALQVGVDTSTSGVKTGTATITLNSDGQGTSGLGLTGLTPQTVNVTGRVYQTAVASVAPSVSFGVVHVGDTATRTLAVGNAATGALTDSLKASLGAVGGGFTGSGSAVVAGGGTSSALSINLNTAAAGVFNSGSATVNLASSNADLADLALPAARVALSGTVNNYAIAAFGNAAGAGAFAGSGARYTLDFGTLKQGSGIVSEMLAALNSATGPADLLSGSFGETGSGFSLAGFTSFSGLAAGGATGPLSIEFDTSTLGRFSETITLASLGFNTSGYSGALGDVTLTVTGTVAGNGGDQNVPEPASAGALAIALAGLARLRRRAI